MHTADVKGTLRVFSIEVAAREKDDLNEDPIVVKLRKVRCTIRSGSVYTDASHESVWRLGWRGKLRRRLISSCILFHWDFPLLAYRGNMPLPHNHTVLERSH